MVHSRSRRPQRGPVNPLAMFLLVASFGILFAGCKGPEDAPLEDYSFTAEDLAQRDSLLESGSGSSESAAPYLEPLVGSGAEDPALTGPVLDLGLAQRYNAIRTAPTVAAGSNLFRVTNDFVNLRSAPDADATFVARIEGGEVLDVVEFANAAWAKVKVVGGGQEGFVSTRYIAKLVSEEELVAEKRKYEGKYFVNYGYVNVRRAQDSQSEKLGEIPGQTIITPLSVDGQWARVTVDGKEGYVSMQYISPFTPNMLVRQQRYTLPILLYDLRQPEALSSLTTHLAKLSQAGMRVITMKEFYDVLLRQEERDVRLPAKSVVVGISGVNAANQAELSALLLASGVKATLFLETQDLGIAGITEKMASTMLANGFDLQSGGHTGDDLRGLTNAQLDLELRQSRQLLEELTGTSVFAIGYPQGGVNQRVMESAMKAGYLLGVSDAPNKTFTREDLLRLPSFPVSPTMTPDEVLKLVQS